MPCGRSPGLVAVSALLLPAASGMLKPGRPVRPAPPREQTTGPRGAPSVMRVDTCGGSKPVVDGIVVGLVLGMQISFPIGDDVFSRSRLSREVATLYRDYWCGDKAAHRESSQDVLRSLWCGDRPYSPLSYSKPAAADETRTRGLKPTLLSLKPGAMMDSSALLAWRRHLAKLTLAGHGPALLTVTCSLFNLKVDESDAWLWKLWWRVNDALDFVDPIKEFAKLLVDSIEDAGDVSLQGAKARGFPPFGSSPRRGSAFNVLHVRTDGEWVQHCREWAGLRYGVLGDNCMNNTQSIAEVLVTEGLDPRVPLYVDSPLTADELRRMDSIAIRGQYGRRFRGLTEAFTVITKGTILEYLQLPFASFSLQQWAAVDFLVASDARDYVGNSVAEESAFTMIVRRQRGQSAWHYNGGSTPLQETGALKPFEPLYAPILRKPIKWVFTVHGGKSTPSKSLEDEVKVAVLSARERTSLIPVCITTADPRSTISRWLVARGVRVVHHTPTWAPEMFQKVRELQNMPDSTRLDTMLGALMRIDIPILGILDEFVLYTAPGVLFRSEIDWDAVLAGMQASAALDRQGLPPYFSTSSDMKMSKDPSMMKAGAMLMNLRSLRQTYENFKDYIFLDPDLQWDKVPDVESAMKSFYSHHKG